MVVVVVGVGVGGGGGGVTVVAGGWGGVREGTLVGGGEEEVGGMVTMGIIRDVDLDERNRLLVVVKEREERVGRRAEIGGDPEAFLADLSLSLISCDAFNETMMAAAASSFQSSSFLLLSLSRITSNKNHSFNVKKDMNLRNPLA